jgi:hypothetical protein
LAHGPGRYTRINVLGIDALDYRPLEDVLKAEELGPKYTRASFNGYAAGFQHLPAAVNEVTSSDAFGEHYGTLDQWEIPFGNRNFYIFFQPSELSPDEGTLASKMLETVTLRQGNEDLKETRVEACTK